MPRRPGKVPSYCLHKHSGQAVVRFNGRDHYLGSYGSPESHERYESLVARWRASQNGTAAKGRLHPQGELSINELILEYWRFAENRYVKDGKPTDEQHGLRAALRPVRRLFGQTRVDKFGPKALKLVRKNLIEAGPSRRYVNDNISRIRRMFKWAASEELVNVSVFQALQTVPGLRAGESMARETEPVGPVTETNMKAIFSFVAPQIVAMVEMQYLTGARPGEITSVRPCCVAKQDSPVWVYLPDTHKTQHRGRQRQIFLGPRAQAILQPWLKRDPTCYCFSPAEAVAEMRSLRKLKWNLKRRPGGKYRVDSYRTAIRRACLKAGVPVWTPNQLRHSSATLIREKYGIEAAQTVLGHAEAAVTQIYAERDFRLAASIMQEIG